jgi:hypothetical protein
LLSVERVGQGCIQCGGKAQGREVRLYEVLFISLSLHAFKFTYFSSILLTEKGEREKR